MAILVYIFVLISFSVNIITKELTSLQMNFIDNINQKNKTLMDSNKFNPNTSEEYFVSKGKPDSFRRVYLKEKTMLKCCDVAYYNLNEIPQSFDARKQWKRCWTIGRVRKQKCCSNWAMSVVDAFVDRLCIATTLFLPESEIFDLSVEEIILCCKDCGYHAESNCLGGDALKAWKYLKEKGVVTQGCAPNRVDDCPRGQNWNATCPKTCYGNTNIRFSYDKKNTMNYYHLTFDAIQMDIMTYGPVTATIAIHKDYYDYKSGVYIKSEDTEFTGYRVVKLIGWGMENGTPYWLCVDSRGEHWGDKGLIKIRRGTNELNIEDSVCAGVPLAFLNRQLKHMKTSYDYV